MSSDIIQLHFKEDRSMMRWVTLLVWSIFIINAYVQAQLVYPLDTLSTDLLKKNSPTRSLLPLITSTEAGTTQSANTQSPAPSWGNWSPMGTGTNAAVWAIAASGSRVYAGGSFTTAGGISANYIALWNGINWQRLGTGMSGSTSPAVYSIAIDSPSVYAGGSFFEAGGITVNSIARWDTGAWHALGSGLSDSGYGLMAKVDAITFLGGYVYVGGSFTNAGAVPTQNIARWNGTTWEAVGSGFNGTVRALAVMDGNLYAAGTFDSSGSTRTPYIAMWDGSAWQSVGGGTSYQIFTLAVHGSTLYAGGYFSQAGGTPANNIASWNGVAWQPLGSGIDLVVYSLTFSESDLLAGGFFTTAGGQPASMVAKWNGAAWSPLGSGVDYMVEASSASGTDVYFGGFFGKANGQPVSNIAHYRNIEGTELALPKGWSLVSVPRVQVNYHAESVFPGKFGAMFGYNMTIADYEEKEILSIGSGYWVFYVNATTITVYGPAPSVVTITTLLPGWLLLGSRERTVQVSEIILDNGATIFGSAFRYNNSIGDYQETMEINPGEGVWIFVTKACTIRLPD
jgi:hypothetical protein